MKDKFVLPVSKAKVALYPVMVRSSDYELFQEIRQKTGMSACDLFRLMVEFCVERMEAKK